MMLAVECHAKLRHDSIMQLKLIQIARAANAHRLAGLNMKGPIYR